MNSQEQMNAFAGNQSRTINNIFNVKLLNVLQRTKVTLLKIVTLEVAYIIFSKNICKLIFYYIQLFRKYGTDSFFSQQTFE